jgi:retron-type reverse transcriptase
MEPKNSADINGMSTKMIKDVKFEIATPLVHIFNLSLNDGVFPENLKCSRTVPIFKAGSPLLCDNYRPISLLSVISKVLEKYVANKLTSHLADNNLLYEHQYGFQKGKSTVHNLLVLTNFVAKEINDKKFVVGLFLDLKKAFDVVNHSILLKKLKKFGIKGKTLEWFRSYLSNRSQKVEINGVLSEEGYLELSVLQGSILGPILFLCFINDIYNATLLFTLLFADDTAALDSDQDLPSLVNRVNIELNKLANWFRANKMAVNISKTKYIIFRPRGTLA